MSKTEILQHFTSVVPVLSELSVRLEQQLQDLLRERGLKIHSLTARTKLPEGLEQKLSRPDRDYGELYEVTDLIGVRVITYSEDMIEEVAHLIESSFTVDFKSSTNKLRSMDDQKFGYRSLHYICSLPPALALPESLLPSRFRFEIQIRTILQHTWAEIEHDLGYKANSEFPSAFRRRFSQVASLLEIADREFADIRKDILLFGQRLREREIGLNGNEAAIILDEISLMSLLARPEVLELDHIVAARIGKPLSEEAFFPYYLLKVLHAAEITTLDQLLESISKQRAPLENFISPYFEFSSRQWGFSEAAVASVKKGYSLLFIAHLEVLRKESLMIDKLTRMAEFYRRIDYPDNLPKAQQTARDLISGMNLGPH